MPRDDGYIGKRILNMDADGTRGRGRPKRRWTDSVKDDLREECLTGDEYGDKARWNKLAKNFDPT